MQGNRASWRDGSPRHPASFTLIETLLVVAIVAVIAAVLAGGLLRSAGRTARRATLAGIVETAAATRLEALRTGRATSVTVSQRGEELSVESPRGSRPMEGAGLALCNERGEAVAMVGAEFDSDGRTACRQWRLAVGAAGERDKMWRIEFDPLSGVPRLVDASSTAARTDKSR